MYQFRSFDQTDFIKFRKNFYNLSTNRKILIFNYRKKLKILEHHLRIYLLSYEMHLMYLIFINNFNQCIFNRHVSGTFMKEVTRFNANVASHKH